MEKKKIIKMILLVVLTVVIIFAIHVIRNYIIISRIYEEQLKFSEATNFYMLIENRTFEEPSVREIYKKDGKSIMKYQGTTIWSDKEAKEVIIMTTDKKAIISSPANPLELSIPCFVQKDCKDQIINLALISFISYDKIDGEKCYVINWGGAKDYISVESGKTLQTINGKTIKEDREYDTIQRCKEIKMDEVTDEMISRPDLSEYEIIYSN